MTPMAPLVQFTLDGQRAGAPERSAVSEVIASPSTSDTVTSTVIRLSAGPLTVAGAVTTGGCGSANTVIAVGVIRRQEPASGMGTNGYNDLRLNLVQFPQ